MSHKTQGVILLTIIGLCAVIMFVFGALEAAVIF